MRAQEEGIVPCAVRASVHLGQQAGQVGPWLAGYLYSSSSSLSRRRCSVYTQKERLVAGQKKELSLPCICLLGKFIQSFSELGLDAMCRQSNGFSKGGGGGGGGRLTVTCSCSAFIYTTGL